MLELEFIIGVLALLFAVALVFFILKKPQGDEKVREIAEAIHKGALTFLKKEYEILAIFVVIVAAVMYFVLPNGPQTAVAFIGGAVTSALAGNFGMRIATKANSRTAVAVKQGIKEGLQVAFYSGAVMGLTIVGIGLLGVVISFLIFKDPNIIYGFGFGASSIALFARVGGGIYTKAADVGADLVGKVEKGIPEDDPRNPAVIADNVGDNVGDVAGMGADLYESYVNSIISTMVIGTVAYAGSLSAVTLPISIAAVGIACSMLGVFFVRGKDPMKALNMGVFASTILTAIISYFVVKMSGLGISIYYASLTGLFAGFGIGLATEYYTSSHRKPTKSIAMAAQTGAGTNVIQGIAVGMMSTLLPVLIVCVAVLLAYQWGGFYGIAISAVGMLSTLGITLAIDTYGPVADNAAGIAEMAHMGEETRKRAESLDAVGNTTAAIGKGFAIGSAALTALALFASYAQITHLETISIIDPKVVVGLFIGGMLPFLFSAFAIQAVGKSASEMVNEVRRQFKTIKGLMKGKAKPDYERCVAISTRSALKNMIVPSLLAIFTPIAVGMWLGAAALGGLLAGATVTGFTLAVFMANAGGAWDNAKKYIEEGNFGGKGSDAHKASVVGDTIGDPFKDTAGPSLNILIKLMSVVAVVFVPLLL